MEERATSVSNKVTVWQTEKNLSSSYGSGKSVHQFFIDIYMKINGDRFSSIKNNEAQ